MNFTKYTYGYVAQTYENNVCIKQEFTAVAEGTAGSDPVEFVSENQEIDPPEGYEYQPFDMVQPDRVAWRCPDCGRELKRSDWTYGDMAQSGTPVCDCGTDMDYIPKEQK